jgi:hypothetical protein
VAKGAKVVKPSEKKVKAVAYTVESVLGEWSATTEYGITLSDEDKIPFEKKSRDHMAKQEMMKEYCGL